MRTSHVGWLICVVVAIGAALIIVNHRMEREDTRMVLTPAPPRVVHDEGISLSFVYQFEVIQGPLRIRSAPYGDIIRTMAAGETFTANLTDQQIAGDMVWIMHTGGGFSALHTVDGSQRFVKIVGVLPPPDAVMTDVPYAIPTIGH